MKGAMQYISASLAKYYCYCQTTAAETETPTGSLRKSVEK